MGSAEFEIHLPSCDFCHPKFFLLILFNTSVFYKNYNQPSERFMLLKSIYFTGESFISVFLSISMNLCDYEKNLKKSGHHWDGNYSPPLSFLKSLRFIGSNQLCSKAFSHSIYT